MKGRAHLVLTSYNFQNLCWSKRKNKAQLKCNKRGNELIKGPCGFTMPCAALGRVLSMIQAYPTALVSAQMKSNFLLNNNYPFFTEEDAYFMKKEIINKTKWYLEPQAARNSWIVYIGMTSKFFIWKTVNRDYFGMQGFFFLKEKEITLLKNTRTTTHTQQAHTWPSERKPCVGREKGQYWDQCLGICSGASLTHCVTTATSLSHWLSSVILKVTGWGYATLHVHCCFL